MAPASLSKPRYVGGLQCLRRLWLMANEPEDFEAPGPGSPFDAGREVGRMARQLFPGGVLVANNTKTHAAAVTRTAALMAAPDVPAIFEAAFAQDGIHIRVDVLARRADGWELIGVRSSSSVKDHHLDDIALQAHVLAAAGVRVRAMKLLHIDTGYVRGHGAVEWRKLFFRAGVTAKVRPRVAEVPDHLATMKHCLRRPAWPDAEPGSQCSKPYGCPFWDRCTAKKPADWVFYLPRQTASQAQRLQALGIAAISDIPADFPLIGKQTVIRDVLVSGEPFVAPDLGRLLHRFGPPACYLDFEAMMPAIPLYEGTKPYQTLPFQWSLHIADAAGAVEHFEFLAPAGADPRRAFTETLIAALGGSDAPIVVYSSYERTQLKNMAALFPDLAPEIGGIIDRLADLLPVVREAVYFPAFDFSHSIKAVAPALSPGFGYDDLTEIGDGGAAAAAFAQMASGAITDAGTIARLRGALLEYCKRDTWAMVEVHRALVRLAAPKRGRATRSRS